MPILRRPVLNSRRGYNSLLQPTSVTAVAGATTQLGLTFNYVTPNNGNLFSEMKGGTPAQINMMRERGAEGVGAVAYLRDRFAGKPGDNMPKRIQQAIQSFEKGK
jgi:hypothetical protein